jgi:RHS repeat-associated protein
MLQAGRSRNAGGYRFGFNGMEQTKGVQGDGAGTFYDYKNRDYDPWKIRFNRVDPIAAQYPMLSTYQFASNRPIDGIDMDGLEFSRYKTNPTTGVLEDGWSVTYTYSIENGYDPAKAQQQMDRKKGELGAFGFDVQFTPASTSIYHVKFDGNYTQGNGITTPGSNTQRGLFIIGPSSKDRTLAHEMLTHGGGLEHINVSTSLLYNTYRNFVEEYCAISDNAAGIKELENNNYNLLNNVTNTKPEDNSMPPEIASFPNLPSKLVRQGLELVHQQYHYPGDGYTILPEQIDQLKANIVRQMPPQAIPSIPSPNQIKQ